MNEIMKDVPKDVCQDVPQVLNNLNEITSTSRSGPDVPKDVCQDVPPLMNGIPTRSGIPSLNENTPTSETPKVEHQGGTLDPDVGPGPEKDVRSIFRESRTFKQYFDSNSNDATFIPFLDVNQNFLELPDAEGWELYCEFILDRFIEERKNKKLQDVLLDIINQGFYTKDTKEKLRNMSSADAIDYIIRNQSTDYEVNVLRPKIDRYFKYLKELNNVK